MQQQKKFEIDNVELSFLSELQCPACESYDVTEGNVFNRFSCVSCKCEWTYKFLGD